MAKITQIVGFWNILTEFDLRTLENQALSGVQIALVGGDPEQRIRLASQMRCDPARPDQETDTPVLLLDLQQADQAHKADLVVLIVDGMKGDFQPEKTAAFSLASAGKRVLVFVVLPDAPADKQPAIKLLPWEPRFVVYGPLDDEKFLHERFVPTMIRLAPDFLLPLGRDFPLFRIPIARYMISDTSTTNAAYSLATGMAEIVPIMNIPLVVTDTIILTKNQAFMAYKLGLVFGFSTEWRNYLTEFGSVLGFGFLLRQFARMLIGLIPGFGIIPKVGVAYAGTVVVGNAIFQWYVTGRKVSGSQLKKFYTKAFEGTKQVTGRILGRRSKRVKQLPAPQSQPENMTVCGQCQLANSAEAKFCMHCGAPLAA